MMFTIYVVSFQIVPRLVPCIDYMFYFGNNMTEQFLCVNRNVYTCLDSLNDPASLFWLASFPIYFYD